jgi:hypothetical protein
MVAESIKLAREQTKQEVIKAGKDVAVMAIASPLFQMLAFCVAVETLQKVKVANEPIISPFLGGTLETIVVSTETLKAVGESVGSLAGNLIPLKGLLGG